jgi:hypothetical protein
VPKMVDLWIFGSLLKFNPNFELVARTFKSDDHKFKFGLNL